MPHIVTDKCLGCRFTECVETCPVSCFHEGEDQLFIDPDACIDCSACVPACPIHAIYEDCDLPDEFEHMVEINEEKAGDLPVIRSKQEPLPGAEERKTELGF